MIIIHLNDHENLPISLSNKLLFSLSVLQAFLRAVIMIKTSLSHYNAKGCSDSYRANFRKYTKNIEKKIASFGSRFLPS